MYEVEPATGKTDKQLAGEGLDALPAWMEGIGAATKISSLGVTEEMLEGIARATFISDSGFRKLTCEEIIAVLRKGL